MTDILGKTTDNLGKMTDNLGKISDNFVEIPEITVSSDNLYCEICDVKTCSKYHYDRHMITSKHKKKIKYLMNTGEKMKNPQYSCICGKIYNHRQSLSSHRKKCSYNDYESNFTCKKDMTDKDMIFSLLKQNDEFKNILMEFMKNPPQQQILNNNNNTNSHNKQFNLKVYLNETCKDAMNLSEFVDSLVIKASELEDMGRLGYAQGISNIIIRGLNELDETQRPFHCTDKKREIIYIKENNVWEKETMGRLLLRKMIRAVAHRNFKRMPQWMLDNPSCDDTSTKKHVEYMSIVNQVMTGLGPEDDIGINKIIRNVANYIYLDKGAIMMGL